MQIAKCVFLEFYRSNKETDKLQNPKAYLFGIARKLIGDYYRQKDKQPEFLEEVAPEIADKLCYDNYGRDVRTKDLIEEIHSTILELPPKAKEAVELKLIDGLSPKKAAQKIGCSVNRFYDRFHEGRKIVREKIKSQLL